MVTFLHIIKLFTALRMNEVLPFSVKWIHLQSIVLRELFQAQEEPVFFHLRDLYIDFNKI